MPLDRGTGALGGPDEQGAGAGGRDEHDADGPCQRTRFLAARQRAGPDGAIPGIGRPLQPDDQPETEEPEEQAEGRGIGFGERPLAHQHEQRGRRRARRPAANLLATSGAKSALPRCGGRGLSCFAATGRGLPPGAWSGHGRRRLATVATATATVAARMRPSSPRISTPVIDTAGAGFHAFIAASAIDPTRTPRHRSVAGAGAMLPPPAGRGRGDVAHGCRRARRGR